MATVVSIMDRPGWQANTDVIVVVDCGRRSLTWVPRDLWSAALGDRVNQAYKRGGHELLAAALAGAGLEVEHGLCLGRRAVENGFAGVEITMPIEQALAFWYPLKPGRDIEEGRKRIEFRPPVERLAGERLHQWIGARYAVEPGQASDLDRIRRQQQLVAVMLGDGFDFTRFLVLDEHVAATSEAALAELALVRADWRFATLGPVRFARKDDKEVLVLSD